jgi:hypothetical protein
MQEVVEYVPREKRVTDYYAVEYTTEYVPQVYQEKYIGKLSFNLNNFQSTSQSNN